MSMMISSWFLFPTISTFDDLISSIIKKVAAYGGTILFFLKALSYSMYVHSGGTFLALTTVPSHYFLRARWNALIASKLDDRELFNVLLARQGTPQVGGSQLGNKTLFSGPHISS
jgi:hypothetical protein